MKKQNAVKCGIVTHRFSDAPEDVIELFTKELSEIDADNKYAVLTPKMWSIAMENKDFSDADYGEEHKLLRYKLFNGIRWRVGAGRGSNCLLVDVCEFACPQGRF